MTDPRYPDPVRHRAEYLSSNAMWGWVAGIAVLALVVIFLIAGGGTNNQMAEDKGPPPGSSTTGQAPAAPPLGTTGRGGAAIGKPGSSLDKNDSKAEPPAPANDPSAGGRSQ